MSSSAPNVSTTAGPLSHITVLDLSRVLAGPWCGQNLADMGARVIKVERPASDGHPGGDDTRQWGPPWLQDAHGKATSEAAYYLSANRGKRSIALDIASAEGQEVVKKLAAQADIVLENYKVGQLKKYGLDYASLKAINPRIVYCSITGFGQTGPYAPRAGYDYVVQGMGGLMSLTGERDDKPGGGPQKVGVAVADLFTGMYATVAVLGALAHATRTGEGQHVDLALLDCQVAMTGALSSYYFTSGKVPGRAGNGHVNMVPYQVFEASDGQVIIACGNDGQYAKFCTVGGRPELATDARFASNPKRIANRDLLIPELEAMVKRHPKMWWMEELEKQGVPAGPINNLKEVYEDPQVQARGMKVEVPHPSAGSVPLLRSPMLFSGTPLATPVAPPLMGEHTDAVLGELGYDAGSIAALRRAKVIQ
jgi:crotonobetainyl-CoA:carnitine CoA-transferase CaiB-like acyl-CoA transferase